MKQIPIAEATRADLVAHCTAHGLEFDGRTGESKLRALIAASGWDKDWIQGEDAPAEPAQPAKTVQGDRVRIIIHDPMGEGGNVKLSHNGRMILVPRGEEVEIDKKYLTVLKHAKQQVYAEGVDGLPEPREAYAYPFSVL